MLQNMFINGRPPGNYDRLLDFSRATTGNLFFAPSSTFLENPQRQLAPKTMHSGWPSPQRRRPPPANFIRAHW